MWLWMLKATFNKYQFNIRTEAICPVINYMIICLILETPEAPLNLTVESTLSRKAVVSWKKPYDGNTDILFYIVQYIQSTGMIYNISLYRMPLIYYIS